MITTASAAQIRAAEEPLLAAGVPLMDQAAFALAVQVVGVLRAGRPVRRVAGPRCGRGAAGAGGVVGASVVVLAGPGNNGGDGLGAGAELARRGCAVTALVMAEQGTGDQRDAGQVHAEQAARLRAAGGRIEPWSDDALGHVAAADVVIDAVLGIGAVTRPGAVADRIAAIAAWLRATPAVQRPVVVAADVPSGIDADTGAAVASAVIPADITVTFGVTKPGLLLPPAALLAGRIVTVDLGLDLGPEPSAPHGAAPMGRAASPHATGTVARLEAADVATLWPWPGATDAKYSRGVVLAVVGSAAYPGAAALAVAGAQAAAAGMVRLVAPEAVTQLVMNRHPEVVAGGGRFQAALVGSGIGADDQRLADVRAAMAEALVANRPCVVDAGALPCLPPTVPASWVLTPHAGELARLLTARGRPTSREQVEAEPLRFATVAHDITGATVLLKGAVTVVVGPGMTWAQADGSPWLATAGSGDVLAGLLVAAVAARADQVTEDPQLAGALAAAAAWLHGMAGRQPGPAHRVAARASRVLAELATSTDAVSPYGPPDRRRTPAP